MRKECSHLRRPTAVVGDDSKASPARRQASEKSIGSLLTLPVGHPPTSCRFSGSAFLCQSLRPAITFSDASRDGAVLLGADTRNLAKGLQMRPSERCKSRLSKLGFSYVCSFQPWIIARCSAITDFRTLSEDSRALTGCMHPPRIGEDTFVEKPLPWKVVRLLNQDS